MNPIFLIIIIIAVSIIIYIKLKLFFAALKLYDIDEKIQMMKMDSDSIDTKVYELTLIQKEQIEILKEINAKLSNNEQINT